MGRDHGHQDLEFLVREMACGIWIRNLFGILITFNLEFMYGS